MNSYDHALGRLDALFEEAKWLRKEVESMKAAEQSLVKEPCLCTHDISDIKPGGILRYDECCRKKNFESGQSAPTVERFVMWGDVNTNWDNPMVCLRGVTKRKRGEVVATMLKDRFWNVVFPDGGYQDMNDTCYQTLKCNGCFGEQVK